MDGARWIKGALLYFGAVFGAGFLIGIVRVLWLVPKVGARFAELLELPLMVLVSFATARWIVRRMRKPYSKNERVALGILALLFMVGAELAIAVLLLDTPISDVVTKRDPISGIAYLFALLLFAWMPVFVCRRGGIDGRRRHPRYEVEKSSISAPRSGG